MDNIESLVIDLLLVPSRLGNWYIQLHMAVNTALKHGIKAIYCPEEFFGLIKEGESEGISFFIGKRCASNYFKDTFWDGAWIFNSDSAGVIANLLIFKYDSPPSGDFTLHIHFRGGDIFGVNPHYLYAPPPLAYYKKVLLREPWREVVLVMEDDRNPFVKHIIDIIGDLNIPWRIQSSSVFEDINELFSAKNLVACVGTFLTPIIATSVNLKKYYFFKWSAITHRNGVQTIGFRCEDTWLPCWKNTEEQRKEVLDYQEHRIVESPGIEYCPPSARGEILP